MRISSNSVRRVKWFSKMGFTSDTTPIPTLLCSVLPNGGTIGQVSAVAVRKYPVIYMCKDVDGKTVFRNERSNTIFTEKIERNKAENAEKLYEKLLNEVESKYQKPRKLDLTNLKKNLHGITDPEILFRMVDGADEDNIQSHLSADQIRLLLDYKDELTFKIKSEVQKLLEDKLSESSPTLTTTKLLKVRLKDFFTEKHALLTIWRPSDDDLAMLSENKVFEFYNVIASGTRDNVLQLSSSRYTSYSPNNVLKSTTEYCRKLTPLSIIDSPGFCPLFSEVDVIGIVVLVKLPEQSRGVTSVFLSDLDYHYLSITFWTSLNVFGCEDMITEGAIISCSNLQWRSVSCQRKIPSVFASEVSSFSLMPKESHLQQGIAELKSKLGEKDLGNIISVAKTHIIQSVKYREFGHSPRPISPAAVSLPETKSTPGQKSKFLSRFWDEPPPLSPIPLTVTTRQVFKNFKSPCQTSKAVNKKLLREKTSHSDSPQTS